MLQNFLTTFDIEIVYIPYMHFLNLTLYIFEGHF